MYQKSMKKPINRPVVQSQLFYDKRLDTILMQFKSLNIVFLCGIAKVMPLCR
jgi:hypothetical protein